MKKIKKFVLVIFILLATGCDVNYNLEFKDNSINENISIVFIGDENNEENIEKMKFSAENGEYAISELWNHQKYNFDYKRNKNKFEGIFSFQYTLDNFTDANLIHQCYDSYNFVKTDNGYALITSDIFRCGVFSYLEVNSYTFTIKTNHVVERHNADIVENNKYIWKMVPNGEIDIEKPIQIYFSDKTTKDELIDKIGENSKLVLICIIGIIAVIGVAVIMVFTTKNRRNNS